MEQQKPTYGSTEALQQGVEDAKSDAADAYDAGNVANRLENRLGDGGAVEAVQESAEAETARLADMAQNLGGTILPGEVEDPRG